MQYPLHGHVGDYLPLNRQIAILAGVASWTTANGVHEFKLNGKPFGWRHDQFEAMATRQVCLRVH
jgi:hypothetical protein